MRRAYLTVLIISSCTKYIENVAHELMWFDSNLHLNSVSSVADAHNYMKSISPDIFITVSMSIDAETSRLLKMRDSTIIALINFSIELFVVKILKYCAEASCSVENNLTDLKQEPSFPLYPARQNWQRQYSTHCYRSYVN
jgi:hypothetical protein